MTICDAAARATYDGGGLTEPGIRRPERVVLSLLTLAALLVLPGIFASEDALLCIGPLSKNVRMICIVQLHSAKDNLTDIKSCRRINEQRIKAIAAISKERRPNNFVQNIPWPALTAKRTSTLKYAERERSFLEWSSS